ncbi:Potassium transporter 5 [Apostasia shenzhenica]|uniref:Potassium transporter n=1 Tax=Apostasia shenzhenica TaxID=1088818 RepID=A0A2I0AQC4_9ASPA|nr:Potassium transporter 5 [Apostasia shenzhenica]
MEEEGRACDVVLNMDSIDIDGKGKNEEAMGGEPELENNGHAKDLQRRTQFHRFNSLEKEASKVFAMAAGASKAVSVASVLQLAFQSIGVVYGDIGTSPLYVFSSTFSNRVPSKNDVLGALSLIIYTLTLFPLIKYVFIVLWANDNGDGGTFALYSLICRHSKVSAIPNERAEEKLKIPSKNLNRAEKIKEALERSSWAKTCLLSLALLGTCMVIGDGVLTPCISVLSAVDGVRKFDARMSKDVVAIISVVVLVLLFSIQRFGTDKVGYTFAPAILVWYLFIGIVGICNILRHDVSVLKAFNPFYIVIYFKRGPKEAWISLGGIVLCMTGTEAMFADLGHFSVRSIQIAFSGLVYPCLICAYVGQAAYLSIFPNDISDAFYKSVPVSVYWPMFVVAVMASVIASQAMISATFSIIKQSMALGCFPRVRVIHTSHKHEGQVFIPEINFFLLLACVFVTASFKETTNIGNAYGIAVVAVMVVTTSLLVLIMLMIWQTSLLLILLFLLVFGSFELLYFSSVLYKFTSGGYLPLTFASVLFLVMYVWHYVQTKRHNFEVEQKISTEHLNTLLGSDVGVSRVPGIGLLYTELTHDIPAIFPHFLSNLPAIHSVLILVSVKYLPVNYVPEEERFLLRRVEEEIEFLERSRSAGVVYLLGHSEVRASESSSLMKRVIVDHVYDFLRRNCRQGFVDLQVPNKNLLQVGMNYNI